MFKKSIPNLSPPEPPTIDEILEDLETFRIDKPVLKPTREVTVSQTKQQQSEEEWWKAFETFLQDCTDFKTIRSQILEYKNRLKEADDEILEVSNQIKKEIEETLERAANELE